jgi:hypothetical protein
MPVNYREVAYIGIHVFTPSTERRDVLEGERDENTYFEGKNSER